MELGQDLVADREHVLNAHDSVFDQTRAEEIIDYRDKGFSLKESGVYQLDKNDYHDYINTWESYLPLYCNLKPSGINEYDNLLYNNIFDDKYLFSLVFGKYVKTPDTYGLIFDGRYVAIDDRFAEECLYSSLVEVGGGIIKYRAGANGFGINAFAAKDGSLFTNGKIASEKELKDCVRKCKYGIVQEKVRQGAFANSLFPDSVNTTRIITARKKGAIEHELLGAVQRIGTKASAPTDNFSQCGGSAMIDIDSGVLGSMKTGYNVNNEISVVASDSHPDTGEIIKGKVIPNWSKIKSTILELTQKLPFFSYAAWDISILEDGICIIEINKKSALTVFQVHGGMRNSLLGRKYREHGWLE